MRKLSLVAMRRRLRGLLDRLHQPQGVVDGLEADRLVDGLEPDGLLDRSDARDALARTLEHSRHPSARAERVTSAAV